MTPSSSSPPAGINMPDRPIILAHPGMLAPMSRRQLKEPDNVVAMAVSRPVGRPRASGQQPASPSPRDEIIAVATRLFAEHGFAQTTMSEIARAAGLQQSSLYYWFRRKELILQATFAVNRVPLEFIERIGAGSGSPGLKLYRLLRFDTHQLCISPCDINEVERLATRQPDVFADYWRDRQCLHDWVALLVRAGIDEGEFVEGDADLVALGLLSLDEGVQNRFRHQEHQHQGGATAARFTGATYDAVQVSDYVAASALRSILRDRAELEPIRQQAAAFDDVPAARASP
jgi:AcrR family transcriptional regulator